jgi:ABC-2 type transport system ATP-binding protein
MFLQVAGPDAEVQTTLSALPGVTRVAAASGRDGTLDIEVDGEPGRDVRRDLAAAIVGRGWGLLELRPMRLSLEDIFLSLTTDESRAEGEASGASAEAEVPPTDQANDQGVANA